MNTKLYDNMIYVFLSIIIGSTFSYLYVICYKTVIKEILMYIINKTSL